MSKRRWNEERIKALALEASRLDLTGPAKALWFIDALNAVGLPWYWE